MVEKKVITADEVSKQISELLWSLRQPGQNESGWHNELASVCENHPSSIENWQKGLAKVSLLDALRLMAHLGEPFAKPLIALAGLHVGLEATTAEHELAELKTRIGALDEHAKGVFERLAEQKEKHDAEPIPFRGPIK